ncbi:MAG TPA: serine--tRNA ligase [Candidatus Binataceae bacterium]|nr:serine--tRNA ligase [Candidatus Binataceae bacterium]
MLDIKLVREQPDFVKAELAKCGVAPAEIDRVIECDANRRRLQFELDEMRARRTRESRELGKAAPEERDARRSEMRALGDRIAAGEREFGEVEAELSNLMLGLRNLPRPFVPVGSSEADNRIVRSEGVPREFAFTPLPHWEIGERLGIIDFERGVKLSGTRFYVLMGLGARLERALIAWMLDLKTLEQGYTEVIPPLMVNTATATSTGHLPKNADTMYRDIEEDYWFIPTAEVPLTSLYRDEIIDGARLPIYLTAYTPCFRREKMSAGRDVRGIKRGHQFDKVEMVKLVRPETSDEELEKLVGDASEICRRLEIPFRVVQLCTGDLSFASAATYDIEMWAPGLGEWLEVSSCSTCTDFQMRRANIRLRRQKSQHKGQKDDRPEFLHALNGSGLGLPRTLIAVLENYQQEDGSVAVPAVLRPYMGGVEVIR